MGHQSLVTTKVQVGTCNLNLLDQNFPVGRSSLLGSFPLGKVIAEYSNCIATTGALPSACYLVTQEAAAAYTLNIVTDRFILTSFL